MDLRKYANLVCLFCGGPELSMAWEMVQTMQREASKSGVYVSASQCESSLWHETEL